MKKTTLLILLILILTACSAKAVDETIAVLPSSTETPIPAITPTTPVPVIPPTITPWVSLPLGVGADYAVGSFWDLFWYGENE